MRRRLVVAAHPAAAPAAAVSAAAPAHRARRRRGLRRLGPRRTGIPFSMGGRRRCRRLGRCSRSCCRGWPVVWPLARFRLSRTPGGPAWDSAGEGEAADSRPGCCRSWPSARPPGTRWCPLGGWRWPRRPRLLGGLGQSPRG